MKFPLAAALLVSLGCSHATREPREAAPSRDSDLITAEELGGATGSTVYDAVRQLRPMWMMRSRPTAVLQRSQSQLIVYVDGIFHAAGIESLRTIPIRAVASVRYFSPGNAEARFGPGHLLGAIEVVTGPR
jgi:hypothetical protein